MLKETIHRMILESLQKYEGAIPVEQVTQEITDKLDLELTIEEMEAAQYE
jgi:hypothetical protein